MTTEERRAAAKAILDNLLQRHKLNDVRRILRSLSSQWQMHIQAQSGATQPTGPAPEKEQSNEQ